MTPPRLLATSFLALVLFGTVGLRWLPGLYTGPRLSWLDSLFTATSAVCVTGLIVVDTATAFTPWGQAFLLLLIQLGGLGILTLTTALILVLGRRLSLSQQAVVSSGSSIAEQVDFRTLLKSVLRYTVLLEAVGAALLFMVWAPRFGLAAAWHAVFHSISAFCNAGFSTFSDSLMGFQKAPFTLTVIMLLVTLGGLGFLTLEELVRAWRLRHTRAHRRLSLHTRLVLATSAAFILFGAALFVPLEWRNSFQGLPSWARVLNGVFMSVTARTAGFNTIDYDLADDSANFVTILLMSIGGSPGSTAGGLKTTTFALLGLLAWSRLRGHGVTSWGGRSVPDGTIDRAIGLFVVALAGMILGVFLLVLFELGRTAPLGQGDAFLDFAFEAVSAFNTVGLSMGQTGGLSVAGKWLVIALMYLGRVGPLTFVAAISVARPTEGAREFRFAYEDVLVG
ncbi:MAG: potassium transporter TrkG [Gemmatimonadota bacterium]